MSGTKGDKSPTTRVHPFQIQHTEEESELESQTCSQQTLVHALKPLLIIMTFTGIFDFRMLTRDSAKSRVLKVYRLFIILLFVLNMLRYISTYVDVKEIGPGLVTKLMIHLWYILCLINAIICYKALENPNNMRQFCKLWNNYHKTDKSKLLPKLRRYTILSTTFASFFILGNVVASAYFLYFTNIFDHFIAPFNGDSYKTEFIKASYLAIHLLLSCCWVFTCTLSFLITILLTKDFSSFAQEFENNITEDKNVNQVSLEQYRQSHQAICRMTDVADDTWRMYNGASVVISILLSLLLLYNMCWYNSIRNNATHLIAHLFWLSAVLGNILVVTVSSCYVNQLAHAPLQTMYRMMYTKPSQHQSLQVMVFLSRLTGRPVGLTVSNLFVIDNQTPLNIFGVLATYFIVLIQFQSSSNSVTHTNTTHIGL